jgi:hypothetical protein
VDCYLGGLTGLGKGDLFNALPITVDRHFMLLSALGGN